MTSNKRKHDKTKNAAAEAAQKAKEATVASIVQLVDDEAAKKWWSRPIRFHRACHKRVQDHSAKFDKRHDQPLQKE